VYEGGRPRGLLGFIGTCCWGRLELLELEACGERELGRWVGVVLPWGDGEGLLDELLRFEPTRFLKRAFIEVIRTEGGKTGGMVGVSVVKLALAARPAGQAARPGCG